MVYGFQLVGFQHSPLGFQPLPVGATCRGFQWIGFQHLPAGFQSLFQCPSPPAGVFQHILWKVGSFGIRTKVTLNQILGMPDDRDN